MKLEKRVVKVKGKSVELDFDEYDEQSVKDLIIGILKESESLEASLECGEFICFETESGYSRTTCYFLQVYRYETDEEFNERVAEVKAQEDKEKAKELEMLQRLAKKYPDVKIEL